MTHIKFSAAQNPLKWSAPDFVESPFDMELILKSCPSLLRHWKKRPFVFSLTKGKKITITTRYAQRKSGKIIFN